jgi:NitT/TauT family transport system substrate-binding protein
VTVPPAQPTRRQVLRVLLAATGLVLGSACVESTPAAAPAASGQPTTAASAAPTLTSLATVRVGTLGTIGDAGWWLALERNYFRDQSIGFSDVRFNNAADQIAPLSGGQIDVGGGAISAGLFNAIGRGLPLKAVADKATDVQGHGGVGLLVRQDIWDSGRLRGPADLAGMRLGIAARGIALETALDAFLQPAGLAVTDLDIVQLSFADQVSALSSGRIDLAMTPEPSLTTAAASGAGHIWLRTDAMLPDHVIAAVMYSPKFVTEQPELGQRFMVAYVRALRDYNDAFFKNQPAARRAAIDAFMKYTPLKDPAIYERIVYVGLDPNGRVLPSSLEKDQQYFVTSGQQPGRINLGDVVDMSYAEAAVRVLGSYA